MHSGACMGCSFCDEGEEDDLSIARRKKQEDFEARKNGQPTLRVSLLEHWKKNKEMQ